MTTLSTNAILIDALEKQGRVLHVDVDSQQLEELAHHAGGATSWLDVKSLQSSKGAKVAGLKSHRLYYAQAPFNEEIVEAVVNEANKKTLVAAKTKHEIHDVIASLPLSTSKFETDVVLLLRAIERRNSFYSNNKMLSAEELAVLLNFNDSNTARAANKLVVAHKLIALKKGDRTVYPAFQFNREGVLYPALQTVLPIVNEHEIEHIDLCLWLTEYCSEVLYIPSNGESYAGATFTEMMQKAQKLDKQSEVYRDKPIEALASGDFATFKRLFNVWLSPETYNVHDAGA